jgi:hypothetical protein
MSDPASANPPINPAVPPLPLKKSGISCLGIVAIFAGIFAVVLLIIGILVWQAVSWIKNAPESSMSITDKVKLEPGEQEDATRIIHELDDVAKKKGNLVDESATLATLNGIVQFIIEEEAKKSPQKPDNAVAARFAFKGDGYNARIVMPARDADTGAVIPGMFINVDVDFDAEIVDGKFTKLEVHRVALANKEAPLFARMFINFGVKAMREGKINDDAKQKDFQDGMKAIRLLKREGERIHLIVDGKMIEEIDAKSKAAEPEK